MPHLEVVLPLRPLPQPVPPLNPGGDCGPCVLGGLFGLSVEQVYERFYRPAFGAKIRPYRFSDLQYAARVAFHKYGLVDRVVEGCPPEIVGKPNLFFVDSSKFNGNIYSDLWWTQLLTALDAGYYAITMINHAGHGRGEPIDHTVLICGARVVEVSAAEHQRQVLVASSSTADQPERWIISVEDFLKWHGGYRLILVRPKAVR